MRHSFLGTLQVPTRTLSLLYKTLKLVEKIECSEDVRTDGKGLEIKASYSNMGATS